MSNQNNQQATQSNYLNIIDNNTVLSWFKQNTKSEVMTIISLLHDNLQNFETLYGEVPVQDPKNQDLFYWNVNYQSIAYTLVCNKALGNTMYYVLYPNSSGQKDIQKAFANDTEFGTYIISFLKFLLDNKLLRNLS